MFHKEGLNIILGTFVIVAILMISIDYFEVKNALPIKIFLILIKGLVSKTAVLLHCWESRTG